MREQHQPLEDSHTPGQTSLPGRNYSAITELERDERRYALFLLAILIVAVAFFGLGVLFGRWTKPHQPTQPTPNIPAVVLEGSSQVSPEQPSRNYVVEARSQSSRDDINQQLERAGFQNASIDADGKPNAGFIITLGRYTHDEAERVAGRLRAIPAPKLSEISVVDASATGASR